MKKIFESHLIFHPLHVYVIFVGLPCKVILRFSFGKSGYKYFLSSIVLGYKNLVCQWKIYLIIIFFASHSQQLRCFNLRPDVLPSLNNGSSGDTTAAQQRSKIQAGEGEDWLSSLPYEVLCHVASFLDSLSLSQLALVSRLMRQVCSSLLQERGIVTLRWERKNPSHERAKWQSKPVRSTNHPVHYKLLPVLIYCLYDCASVSLQVWEFSHLFSTVDSWNMADIPPISAHLKVCPYYQKTEHRKPIPLPFITEKQEKSPKGQSLLNHFMGQR